jgi:hypothetical protein
MFLACQYQYFDPFNIAVGQLFRESVRSGGGGVWGPGSELRGWGGGSESCPGREMTLFGEATRNGQFARWFAALSNVFDARAFHRFQWLSPLPGRPEARQKRSWAVWSGFWQRRAFTGSGRRILAFSVSRGTIRIEVVG